MEPHPNAASMLRTRSIPSLPSHHPPPLLAPLSTRMLSPSPSPSSSSTTTSSEARLPYSSLNPKSSFHPFPLFSNPNTHTLQSMTLSKCFSHSGPTNPVPISEIPESDATTHSLVVVSFYKFADFPDHALMRDPLKQLCQQLRVSGGIILAPEGINGSICGTRDAVEKVLAFVQSDDRLKGLRLIESPVSPEEEAIHHGQHGHSASSPLAAGEDTPFRWDHVRVKLKKEIVTLGMPTISPTERVGKYVSPKDWNALISDPDTVVIDVRNNYETRIGKFKGAVDPCTTSFREFPSWVEERFQLTRTDAEHPKVDVNNSVQSAEKEMENPKQHLPRVAMYCTGGIRCEKASSLLLNKGFKEVILPLNFNLFCMNKFSSICLNQPRGTKLHLRLKQLLNTSKTTDHLKQTHALFLKLLTQKPPHHYYHYFLGRLLLQVLRFSADKSNLCYAHKLFDTMPNCPNGFLWTSLIRASLSHHTHFRHCISTYARMHQNGVLPSGFTFSSVLNACGRIPAMFEGKQVHARVVQSGYLGNKIVETALLDMYAKFGRVCDARCVFDAMVDRDVVAWTAMICGYAKVGMMVDARWLFDNMGEQNSYTWTTMVAGYANCGDMKAAKELYDVMSDKNEVTWVAMIAGYGKLGNVSEARRVFDGIPVPQDASTCAAMLACYAQNGYAKEAIEMYEKMRQAKIKITEVALVGAISACAQLSDIRMSNTLTYHLEEGCCDRTYIVSNALIHMHSKCGNIDLAWREFGMMRYRDMYTYSAMIAAFAEHGKSQDAIDLFLKMQQEELKPNQVTFIGVLNACSSSGLIEEGCRFFQIMTGVYGIEPLPEHYACIVDLLGRAGQLERAYNLIKENAISADATTWGSLLAACRVYGNVELGETAARHLFEIDPKDSGNYVLLANTYASNDKWERAEEVKMLMRKRGMKKPSGYSWIQRDVKGQYKEEALYQTLKGNR